MACIRVILFTTLVFMTRLFTFMLSIMSFVCLTAQDYIPTTTWPYLYQDFMSGTIIMQSGATSNGVFNIHLGDSKVHFLEKDIIKELSVTDFAELDIAGDKFICASGKILRVLAESEKGKVVESVSIDQVALNSQSGAYGSSGSTIATSRYSSLEGIGTAHVNMNHMELRASKDDGESIPLVRKLCLVVRGQIYVANKKAIADSGIATKDEQKAFYKTHKIKWKDPQSLLQIVSLIHDNKQ